MKAKRIAFCALRLVSAVLTVLTATGCAVMTVDVDVYKGPFVNHQEVQREQVAALAVGAKPLLRELQVRLQLQQCYQDYRLKEPQYATPSFEQFMREFKKRPSNRPNPCAEYDALVNRQYDALDGVVATGSAPPLRNAPRRIQEILRLYDRRGDEQLELRAFLWDLRRQLADAQDASQKATLACKNVSIPALTASMTTRWNDRNDKLVVAYRTQTANLPPAVSNWPPKLLLNLLSADDSPKSQACAKQWHALQSTVDKAVNSTLLYLSKPGNAAALRANSSVYDVVSRFVRDFLAMESLRTALLIHDHAPALKALRSFVNGEPLLTGSTILGPGNSQTADLRERLLNVLLDASGTALAHDLQDLHLLQVRDTAAGGLGISPNPTTSGGAGGQWRSVGDHLVKLNALQAFSASVAPDLDGGRDSEGIEQLIEEYLAAANEASRNDRGCYVSRRCRAASAVLNRSLVHFAQKLLTLANFDVLLRDNGNDSTADNYVRVLEAVGNSILSQVNELESLREYSKNVRFPRSGRTSLGEMEVRAIESANAAVPDRTAADIAGELQALDMAALGKVLTATDRRNLDEVVGATTTTLHKSVGSLKETERKTSERITNLKPVNDVLRQLHSQAQDPGSVLCRSSPALSDTGLAALRKTVPGLGVLPPGVTWEDLEPSLPETPGVCTTTWADQCIAPCIRALAEAGEAERVALDRFRTDLSRWQTALERGAARQPLPVKRADFLDQARIEADDDDDLPDQPAADAADKTPPVYRDPRRVLGQLLETLRAELAAELRSNGESKKADNLRLSIRLVDQQRQRFVYIRPAVSYLRNSSPATALQDESSVVWKNLLREHLGRSASQGGPDKDILKVQTAIDKQYWQSVNRIRVAAGPSNINYVLVRDDIGNWYVKSYSSSPDDVFRSALNLGLYAAAGAPGKGAQQVAQTLAAVSVKNSNGELESPIGSSVAGTTVTNQDTLDKLQRRYDKGYWNALRDVCKQLNTTFGRMTGPTGALRSAASNAVKEPQARQHFDTSIDANPSYFFEPDARTKPDVTVCESPDEKRIVGDSGTRIVLLNETHAATVALVKAIQTYGSVVAQGLQAGFDQRAIQFFAGPPPAAAPDYRKDVEAAVKTKTSETIRTALDRLTTVADEYAGNLTFMQGAVGNLPAGETP